MKKKFLVFALFIFTASLMEAQSISVGPQLGFIKTKDADKATVMPAVAVRLE